MECRFSAPPAIIRCDCVHIPAREDTADDLRTDPKRFFDSLGQAEQDRVFTRAGAEAIRLGADIGQVVNARRGMTTATVQGREVLATTEGTTTRSRTGVNLGAADSTQQAGDRYRRATRVRLMPESIIAQAAGNRDEAIRLLRRYGYLR